MHELDGAPAFAGLHQGAVVPTYGWCYALHLAALRGIVGLKRLYLLWINCTSACIASVVHLVCDILETDPALWLSVVKHMIVVSLQNIIIPL
jgi:hypothetical protein